MTRKRTDVVGMSFKNSYGEIAVVVEYENSHRVTVEFEETGYKAVKGLTHLQAGKFSSPYSRTVHGVGFIGEGEYNKNNTGFVMARWALMLSRCYDAETRQKNPTYNDCTVVESWHNYQNYAHWYAFNTYRNDEWEVDKDVRQAGCRVYSPATCAFVPPAINSFLLLQKSRRGEHPVGVYWSESNKGYVASCKRQGRDTYLGTYADPAAAFAAYKRAKEAYAKELAQEFVGRVHPDVYNRLMNFTVNIDD